MISINKYRKYKHIQFNSKINLIQFKTFSIIKKNGLEKKKNFRFFPSIDTPHAHTHFFPKYIFRKTFFFHPSFFQNIRNTGANFFRHYKLFFPNI